MLFEPLRQFNVRARSLSAATWACPTSQQFVLLHKLREAMAEEMRGRVVGGEGKEAEIDGGYFGGYIKPANLKEDRIDRRFARNQNGKCKVVVIIRERGGNSVPAVFGSES